MGSIKFISKGVRADDPAQPSRLDLINDAIINVINQRYLYFEKNDERKSLPLKIAIHKPQSLGLKSSDNEDMFVEMVLTACNLLLKEIVLSCDAADTSPVEISLSKPQDRVRIKNEPDRTVVSANLSLRLNMRVLIKPHLDDELDETQVWEVLDMIHTICDAYKETGKYHNLRKSLVTYSEKIVSHSSRIVFQGLFEALEMAVNYDGSDVVDSNFDAKVRSLMGDPSLQIKDLRKANNRLKHTDSNKKQISAYPNDSELVHHISRLRPITVAVILRRLNDMVGKNL